MMAATGGADVNTDYRGSDYDLQWLRDGVALYRNER
jgi:hypothetical protein